MAICEVELIEHPVRFPPPMVLGLGKFRLAIMTVQIGMVGIVAVPDNCSKHIYRLYYFCVYNTNKKTMKKNLLITIDVSRTVTWIDTGKFVWMRLYRMRIKYLNTKRTKLQWSICNVITYQIIYLHHFAKVDFLNQFIDVLIVKIMRKYQQAVLDVPCLSQAYN